jgi:hypothetical protein
MRKDAIYVDCFELRAGSAGVALYEACRATLHMIDPVTPSAWLSLVAGYFAVSAALLIFIPTPADCAAAERGDLDP